MDCTFSVVSSTDKGSKGLTPDQNERVREAAYRYAHAEHGGNVSAAARALGVSQATLGDVINRKKGAGLRLATLLAAKAGKSIDELITGRRQGTMSSGVPMVTFGAGVVATLPGWDEAAAEARRGHPDVPGWAWDAARMYPAPPGAKATADLATDLAYVAWRHTGRAERERLEAEAMARARGRLRAAPRSDA